MTIPHILAERRRTSRGVSLVIVLIMMIIIGITAATAMRTATSEQRATNNQRVEASALQYAEAALRYCESEMVKDSGSRIGSLAESNILASSTPPTLVWIAPASWNDPGTSSRTTVPVDKLQINAAESVPPLYLPQCVVEKNTVQGLLITARGFSPDYNPDPVTGATLTGAVVWVQSAIN